MHVPLHLGGRGILFDLTIHDRLDLLVVEVPVRDQTRAERAQGVAALDSQHRTSVGVSEVVQAIIVGDRVASDVLTGLVGRNVATGLADDDADLTLVVQPFAAFRAHDVALVSGERGDRFVEIRGCGRKLCHELLDAALVVQMHTDDLGRLDRGEVYGIFESDGATVASDEGVAVLDDFDWVTVEKNPAGFGHDESS